MDKTIHIECFKGCEELYSHRAVLVGIILRECAHMCVHVCMCVHICMRVTQHHCPLQKAQEVNT